MKEHTEFCQRHGFTYEVGSGEPIPECICDDGKYVIWNKEREAFWAPNECGYTRDPHKAGRYTLERAGEIVFWHVPAGGLVALPSRYAHTTEPEDIR